ncbi:YjgB family protein [Virgibacillus siamensis]|uniref:YjgB family protein n=1 Tax=Virgibacillus siamensis TaxID=480071 RepID=UPI0009878F67|nr:YjgB family protein [Virgibacillus siamensis]
MFSKKVLQMVTVASLVIGSVLGVGMLSENAAYASSGTTAILNTSNQGAVNTLNKIYNSASKGEMPGNVQGLKIDKSTERAVHQKLGIPQKVEGQFDLYHWEMGQPGFGFAYHNDNTIKEIRYFGTGVERQTNLGGITPDLLGDQLGTADEILNVPGTDEVDYVYKTGNYELHFVIGNNPIINGFDQTVNHVNVKEAK